jgi:HK97 family phage portal protein
MGLITEAFRALIPESKSIAVAASIPTWDSGTPQYQQTSYYRNARDGYMIDELVYDCVEFRATSAGEPPVCAWKKTSSGEEKVEEHPALDLLNRPNPFMGRSTFWGAISMSLDIAGNAYVEIVRSGAGKPVELWPLRPDRIRVIPDQQRFISGYRYTIGDKSFTLDAADVVRFKTRHPLDDYYGLPPLAVLAGRVDLDVWTRRFAESFFRNAGVPTGLLNIQHVVQESERQAIRRRFREEYGGPEGWHRMLVLDGGQATYTPMGMGMGANGLAMDALGQQNEVRILGAFGGIPPSLIPTIAGAGSSSYANRVSDRQLYWEQTMIPWFRDMDTTLTMAIGDEWPDLDRFEHDLSKIKALQEDEDKKFERWLSVLTKSGCTLPEFRQKVGLPEEPDTPGMMYIPTVMVPSWSDDVFTKPEPVPEPVAPPAVPAGQNPNALPPAPPVSQPAANGARNGAAH